MPPKKKIDPTLEDLLKEKRTFSPSAEFRKLAAVKDESLHRRAGRNPEQFWADLASELQWEKRWKKVLDWKPPDAKWFVGGKLNASVNCLDRHVRGARRNKAASSGRESRATGAPGPTWSSAPRGVPVRQRAQAASA